MLITLGFGLVTALIGFLTSRPATAQQPEGDEHSGMIRPHVVPVNVTNTPLPVTGTVNVGNFPATQNVNVTNTSLAVSGSVGVSSLPNVPLNNSNTNPLFERNVDNPATEPFQAILCYGVSNGVATNRCYAAASTQPSGFSVPTTTTDGKPVKALVIQFVDGGCGVSSEGVILDVDLSTQVFQNVIPGDTIQGFHQVPFHLNPLTSSILQWATPLQTIVVASAGVQFFVDTQIGTSCNCSMNLSGYLVTQ